MTRPVAFLIFLLLSFYSFLEVESFGCLNQLGEVVEWWVIYKEFNGLRYVYLDSSLTEPIGLDDDLLITSEDTSPIIKTLLSSGFPSSSADSYFDYNTTYLAWNDQQTKRRTASKDYAHAKVKKE